MKTNRRSFLEKTGLGALSLLLSNRLFAKSSKSMDGLMKAKGPIFLSTWTHGQMANEEALRVLANGGSGLDAVEKGVMLIEADPEGSSVGLGGLPDRTGKVTLDACIMSADGNCGAVCMLENILHPISVARKVMEDTPHVMLAGDGAYEFASANGFEKVDLLTKNSKAAYKNWKKEQKYKPIINVENHDTIGMLGMDEKGDIYGSCTTSGLAYKMRGRIGDSPIIGAGLFIDNEVGGAVATGLGESIIKVAGSAIIVELMRHGYSPQEACVEAVNRIVNNEDTKDIQVGFLAISKSGETGAYAIHRGFNFAISNQAGTRLENSDYLVK